MDEKIHQIRKCLRPSCGFRFPNYLSAEQYIYCPKCGSPTDVVEIPYSSMIGENPQSKDGLILEVLLDNIRSAYNVGSILRTSDGIGINHLHFCGYSPTPDHPKVRKTALDSELNLPWTQYWNSLEAAEKLISEGYQLIALEGSENSKSIFELINHPLPEKIVLVMGNEVSGVDPGLLSFCQQHIWLPMLGKKQSFNVSVAFGIAAYLLRFSSQLK